MEEPTQPKSTQEMTPIAPSPLSQAQTMPLQNQKKSTLLIILLIITSFIAICSVSALLFFLYHLGLVTGQMPNNSKYVTLPVDPKHPEVIDYGVSFYFETTITDIKRQPDGALELVTPLAVPGLPAPNVSTRAVVFKRENNQLIDRTKTDIKKGQRVGLHFYHDKFMYWEVTRVIIINE